MKGIRIIVAVAIIDAVAAQLACGETASHYIQDGLLACWDGVENAGVGVHDPNATVWKDLSGTNVFTLTGATIYANRVYFSGSAYGLLPKNATTATFTAATNGTLEIVYKSSDASGTRFLLESSVGNASISTLAFLTVGNTTVHGCTATSTSKGNTYTFTSGSSVNRVAIRYSKGRTYSAIGNGSTLEKAGTDYWGTDASGTTIMGARMSKKSDQFFKGAIYCIRLYSRRLTNEEILANQAIDQTRFIDGNVYNPCSMTISGAPDEYGTPSPAYGNRTGLAAGDELAVSCPAVHTNAETGIIATCSGWSLYDWQGNAVSSGTGNAFTYEHPSPVAYRRLVWNFDTRYKVSAVSAGNGTVAVASDWVDNDGVATLTATPAEGYAFYKWTGVVDSEHNKENPLNLAITDPTTVTGIFARCCYVSKDGDDENDGLTWATAKATVGAAVALYETAPCVMVSNGIYSITESIRLTNGVVVTGTGDRGAIVKLTASPASGNPSRCAFYIAHTDAAIRNIAVAGRYTAQARGIYMSNGLIDNCAVTNHTTVNNDQKGAGIYVAGGVVRNSLVAHNWCKASGGSSMGCCGGIYIANGLVENCRVSGNKVGTTSGNTSKGGGVYMDKGTLRNTLIAGNYIDSSLADGTGVYALGGTIENCTIAGNYHPSLTTPKALYLGGAVTLRNCIVWNNSNAASDAANWSAADSTYKASNNCSSPVFAGTGNIALDPTFADAANGDYHIEYGPAVNTAVEQGWMAVATDLDGNLRVSGGAPDMGCYEYVSSGIACGMVASATGALDEDDVTLEALVNGDNLAGLTYFWTVTDTSGRTVSTNGTGLATVTLHLPTGLYDVTLQVTTAMGDSATAMAEHAVRICGSDVYVNPAGGNEYPYSSPATAATNLLDAASAAANGTTIHLSDGWHRIADSLNIISGIRIVSANGPEATTIFGSSAVENASLLYLGHAQSMLSGITIAGKDSNGKHPEQWSAIHIANGTVTNCVIRDNTSVNNTVNGAGVRMSGGRVVDCIFSNNVTKSSGGSSRHGGALYATGASVLVERCLFARNSVGNSSASANSYGGGAYLTAGTIRNCVFVMNSSYKGHGGGLAVAGKAIAQNCTVVNNTSATGSGGIYSAENTATVRNCIAWRNTLTSGAPSEIGGVAASFVSCYTNNPSFMSRPGLEYAIHASSPCRNAGENEDWMEGAIDFYGKPRLRKSGDRVDIGATECQQTPSFVLLMQ